MKGGLHGRKRKRAMENIRTDQIISEPESQTDTYGSIQCSDCGRAIQHGKLCTTCKRLKQINQFGGYEF